MRGLTLGSLFDGSGGFPLAGAMHGITPIWASEIEPYPLRVTTKRFPCMKQLGDVRSIDGADIEPVDIVTFGSPCQDLSAAGKQAGIHDGARSRLFFEAVRIIREMRRATHGKYPRFAVWENVHGAFSSNRGEDFQAVLQALCGVCGGDTIIPEPPKGKWKNAGCVMGDGYSVAWRVYDAQYWGVPQRRKRIYLIADFGSERAGEILFEREGVRGNPSTGAEAREGAAADAEGSAGGSCYAFHLQQDPIGGSVSPCIGGQRQATIGAVTLDCRNICGNEEISGTIQAKSGGGFSLNFINPVVYSSSSYGTLTEGVGCVGTGTRAVHEIVCVYPDTARTLTAEHDASPCVDRGQNVICVGNGQKNSMNLRDRIGALKCMHDQQIVVHHGGTKRKYIVRRLTPMECCRLQGFPDWWEDGADGSDSARYKMWGNGIALPCAADVLGRIAKDVSKCQYET